MKTRRSSLLATMTLSWGLAVASLGTPAAARAADGAGSIGRGALALSMRSQTRRFALVVGSNATLDDNQAPLRFADDDAAAMSELLAEVGFDVELVTSLDQESQALHPDLVRVARVPTEKGLERAWDSLRARMEVASKQGPVELLIYYSGHGDVGPDGQGYLTLQGGKLTRNRLFSSILSDSPADHNHVLIDACRSEQFVLTRGKTWKNDRAGVDGSGDVGRYLGKNHLGGHPNTGVIVAHSADQQTHEWERYRGGIFTHELLSGLRGGADLNGDGSVEYSELGAFVAAANSGVKDPRARLAVTVRPPKQDERRPVVMHEDVSQQRVLYFPEGEDQRLYTLEDERGVRLADLRRAGDQPGYLRMPPGDIFISRRSADGAGDSEEATIPAHEQGLTMAPDLSFRRSQRAARGALDQAFRSGLFATPYGPGYYSGYTDQRGLLGIEDPKWRVEVWEVDADGTETKVSQSEVEAPTAEEAAETEVIIEERDDEWWNRGTTWGGLFLGTVLTPFNPGGDIDLTGGKVTSDDFRGCLAPDGPSGCSAVRGLDLRWQVFKVNRGDRYPSVLGYFRSGYTAGRANFNPRDGGTPSQRDATSLAYLAVPLFLGGNIYVFDNFPLRPYAGLGFGFDVIRMRYERSGIGDRTVTKPRIGFELHAGLEARITNHVAINAEVQQLWSARKRLDALPDFSNQGFTVIVGVAAGFELRKSRPPRKSSTVVRSRTVVRPKRVTKNPMSEAEPEAEDVPTDSEDDAAPLDAAPSDATPIVPDAPSPIEAPEPPSPPATPAAPAPAPAPAAPQQ